jgi:hypothetical protein
MSRLVQEYIIIAKPRGVLLCNLLNSLSITNRITPDQSENVVKNMPPEENRKKRPIAPPPRFRGIRFATLLASLTFTTPLKPSPPQKT